MQQISTGRESDKFALSEKEFLKLVKLTKLSKFVKLKCLSIHIGSQISNYKPYEKMLKVIDRLIKKSNHTFEFIDLGGGMGISYEKSSKKLNFKAYSYLVNKFVKKNNCKIIFEPGRSIIGDTAVLLTKIIYIKAIKKKNFIILDAAMNDLIRPALYGAKHQIIPLKRNNKIINKIHDFVGPICESTDKFLSLKKYQKLNEKEILGICDVGAYGMVLASNYNLRTKASEIMVNKSSLRVILKRQKLNNII